jgi:hypothetical protein
MDARRWELGQVKHRHSIADCETRFAQAEGWRLEQIGPAFLSRWPEDSRSAHRSTQHRFQGAVQNCDG